MKNSRILVTAALLVVSIGNYLVIIPNSNVRVVEFISIFAIGALAGILLTQIIAAARGKK